MIPESRSPRTSPVDRAGDIVETVRAYAVQETVGPLKGAARWLAYGTAAAVCLGVGTLLLAVGVLRLSQDAGGTVLDGSWSFVHYLVAAAVLGAAVGLSLSRISKNSLRRD